MFSLILFKTVAYFARSDLQIVICEEKKIYKKSTKAQTKTPEILDYYWKKAL